jgi:hypothetical protein
MLTPKRLRLGSDSSGAAGKAGAPRKAPGVLAPMPCLEERGEKVTYGSIIVLYVFSIIDPTHLDPCGRGRCGRWGRSLVFPEKDKVNAPVVQ